MKILFRVITILSWSFTSHFPLVSLQINHRKALLDYLFSNYSATIRPYCGNNDIINTTIDVALRQVIDLDEPTQILKLNIWVRLEWTDCQLTWNPSDYSGIHRIGIPFETIWTPDLTLYDGTSDDFHFNGLNDFRPIINSNGLVSYNFPSITQTRCIVDVLYFPFDSQTCKLVFGSWSYHGNEVDLVHKYSIGDLATAEQKVEFNVFEFPAKRHVKYYNCCLDPYPDVTFYLKLKRKPVAYVVHLILPTVIITFMACLGFLLPAESGEKVSMQMTVLLSLTVFQLVIAEALPSAAAIPIIAVFFNLCQFLSAFSSIVSVLVIKLYYRDENKEIPRCFKRFFFNFAARFVFVKVHLKKDVKEQGTGRCINPKELKRNPHKVAPKLSVETIGSITDIKQHLDSGKQCNNNETDNLCFTKTPEPTEEQVEEQVCQSNNNTLSKEDNEWKLLAKIVERVSLVTFLVVFILGILAMILCHLNQET